MCKEKESFQTKLFDGILWSFLGQFGYIIVTFGGNIIMARLLSPFEFGQVGIVMFFVVLGKVLSESGLSGALIRKENATNEDYSTMFFFNLVVSLFFFFVLYFTADFIAYYYKDFSLKLILRVSSLVLIFNAFQLVQLAKLSKELMFKKIKTYNFVAVFISTCIGVFLAYFGVGVWAIVTVQLLTSLLLTIFLWVGEGFGCAPVFYKDSFKVLYKFGINTTVASLINSFFENIYQLLLGRYFSIGQTGFFYQAKKLQEAPLGLVKSASSGILFAALAKLQNDITAYDKYFEKAVRWISALFGIVSWSIFVYADNLIRLIYGEKWIGVVFFLQVLILVAFFDLFDVLYRITFKVFDRTDLVLRLEVIKKVLQIFSIIVGMFFLNMKILMVGLFVSTIISYFISFYASQKVKNKKSLGELIIVLRTIASSLIVICLAYLIRKVTGVNGYYTLGAFPFLFAIYFYSLYKYKVLNIRKELAYIYRNFL